MLKPTKYTDVNVSIIGLSTEILKVLNEGKAQKYEQILCKIRQLKGIKGNENFLLSLIFLYSLGKIKYYQEADTIELLFG